MMSSKAKSSLATISVVSKSLGFNDPKELSREITDFWRKLYEPEQFLDCTEEDLKKLAHDFLQENGERLWGDGKIDYPLWPHRKDLLHRGVTDILKRQKRNQHDALTRKQKGISPGNDRKLVENGSRGETTVSEDQSYFESLPAWTDVSSAEKDTEFEQSQVSGALDSDLSSVHDCRRQQQSITSSQPPLDMQQATEDDSKSRTVAETLQAPPTSSTNDIPPFHQAPMSVFGVPNSVAKAQAPLKPGNNVAAREQRVVESVHFYAAGEPVSLEPKFAVRFSQNIVNNLEGLLFGIRMRRLRAGTEQERLVLQGEENSLQQLRSLIEADGKLLGAATIIS